MKRIFIALVLPAALVLGSLGLGVTLASGPAGAAEHAHTTMQHSWHGTISKINAKMGTTSSFSFGSGSKTYVVHWDAMTISQWVPRRTSRWARWSRSPVR